MHSQAEIGEVGAGKRDRTCSSHSLDRRGVVRSNRIREKWYSLSCRRSGDVDVFFDGAGDSVEDTERFTVGNRSIGAVGRCKCLVVEPSNNRVQMRVDGVNAGKMRFHHLST
jgi:hypothetical protein